MREMTAEKQQLMDFDLLISSEKTHYESDLTIYYVLSGRMQVEMGETVLDLAEQDFLILNPFQLHAAELKEHALVMKFQVNPGNVSEYYDISKLDFGGNSLERETGQHVVLRDLLEKCVACYYGKRSNNGRVLLKLNSFYYRIAELLISSFSEERKIDMENNQKGFDETLIREMTGYIRLNYQSALRLEDLAERFFLTPAYISRFFKKNLGINFTRYLTDIRLNEAVRKLGNPDRTLTWIAMDCGFPNLASFNSAFREKFGMSPKEYRNTLPGGARETQPDPAAVPGSVQFQLLEYFEERKKLLEDDYEEIEEIEADAGDYSVLTKNWNKLINIGGISLLLQKEMQDQTLFLCETLDYEYVRVWDLYEKRLHINAGNKDRKYNFSRLDSCLDFLTKHHIKLYLELGFKPFILLKDYEDYTFHEVREIPFHRPEEYGDFIRVLLMHLVNRYSLQQVSSWIFEVWCDPRWFPGGDPSEYIRYFEQAYQAVKEICPQSRCGGGYDRPYGMISFEQFVRKWSVRSLQPDFVSIYCYESVVRDGAIGNIRASVMDPEIKKNFHIEHYLEEQKQILMRYGMMMPVYSSEWNLTVINANVMNDSRFKGAYIMNQLMNFSQMLELSGYWFGTDLFVEEDEAPMLLNGRCGLITHQGICKPAYWAFRMMNRLEDYLLGKHTNAMITMNEFDSYVIACHNYRELDIQYYVQEEREVSIRNISHLYENNRNLTLKIRITGVKNGIYHIKTRVVNSQHGSVQDEWLRMGEVAFLTEADVEYMDHISRPRITISKQEVSDHTLYFTVRLEPQELQLIHAFRYMLE